jgi:predicted metal-dependent enzyme (double-stranded beta helix superfamily)
VVGWVGVDPIRAGALELVFAVTAGHRPTPSARARRAASRSQTLSPTTIDVSMSTCSRSAAAKNRSGSGLAWDT